MLSSGSKNKNESEMKPDESVNANTENQANSQQDSSVLLSDQEERKSDEQ